MNVVVDEVSQASKTHSEPEHRYRKSYEDRLPGSEVQKEFAPWEEVVEDGKQVHPVAEIYEKVVVSQGNVLDHSDHQEDNQRRNDRGQEQLRRVCMDEDKHEDRGGENGLCAW